MGRHLIDIIGHRFGRLVPIGHVYQCKKWTCRCDCGNITQVASASLRNGTVRSCGCLNSEMAAARKRTHGLARTSEYISWCAAKGRCTNPKNAKWADYGGRGITMCREWSDDFTAFLRDVGKRPSIRHSIDRLDVNGHYEPGNVRWATKRQQANNTRVNNRVEWNGQTLTIAELAAQTTVPYTALYGRLAKGWTAERAVSTPLDYRRQVRY